MTLISFLILLKYLLAIIGGIFVLFIFKILILILFGSSVDPDDNGILRSKKQKEKYKQYKLNKYHLNDKENI